MTKQNNIFTTCELKQIEEHINKCKVKTAVVIAYNNNEYTTVDVAYRCNQCGTKVKSGIAKESVMDYFQVLCPCCQNAQELLILNMREN
jgi:hypothetical protein